MNAMFGPLHGEDSMNSEELLEYYEGGTMTGSGR